MQMPYGIFGVSIATVVLPLMSRQMAEGDEKGFGDTLTHAIGAAAFIMIPSTVGLWIISLPICRLAFEHELTLGHFGLPHVGGKSAVVRTFESGSWQGATASVPGRQVAMITYFGWDRLESQVHRGFNAETEESTVLYACRQRTAKNPAMELMITAMLHKTDDTAWTAEELSPVKDVRIFDVAPSGSVLGAEITLEDGSVCMVDFKDVDGWKSC